MTYFPKIDEAKNKLKAFPAQAFTCDNCGEEFTNSNPYSLASSLAELSQYETYCGWCERGFSKDRIILKKRDMSKLKVKKTKKNNSKPKTKALSKSVKTKKPKRDPVAYYSCLAGMAQSGFPNKITACCNSCKQNAPALNVARQQELQQWINNYQKLGADFLHLFTPPHKH